MFGTTYGIKSYDESKVAFAKDMGTVSGGEGDSHSGKFTDKATFVKTLYNSFVNHGINSKVAVCMTAQAALESAWGTSTYAGYSNYGGINHHKGDAGAAPGKSKHNHQKATYKNVGHYVEQKIGIMNRLYKGALTATTASEYFSIIQGGNPNGYCYGGETQKEREEYGTKIMNMLPSIQKYLS